MLSLKNWKCILFSTWKFKALGAGSSDPESLKLLPLSSGSSMVCFYLDLLSLLGNLWAYNLEICPCALTTLWELKGAKKVRCKAFSYSRGSKLLINAKLAFCEVSSLLLLKK